MSEPETEAEAQQRLDAVRAGLVELRAKIQTLHDDFNRIEAHVAQLRAALESEGR